MSRELEILLWEIREIEVRQNQENLSVATDDFLCKEWMRLWAGFYRLKNKIRLSMRKSRGDCYARYS